MERSGLTVVVPCYNEESRLREAEYAAYLAEPGGARLLFVDDGSHDGTARILRRIADAPFSGGGSAAGGLDAFALVDTTPQTLEWASGVYCSDSCRGGRCQALCKVLRDPNGRAVRCSHQLRHYDAVVAGECYATTPRLFELLTELFRLGLGLGLGPRVRVRV